MIENVKIDFDNERKAAVVSGQAIRMLQRLADDAGLCSLTITSTLRTPEGQARAMYYNSRNTGFDKQLALYGPVGRSVLMAAIQAEEECKSAKPGMTGEELISYVEQAMVDEINRQYPKRVSRHVVPPEEYAKLNVVDIGYDSVLDKEAFRVVLANAKSNGSIDYIDEPENDCFHIEIPISTI